MAEENMNEPNKSSEIEIIRTGKQLGPRTSGKTETILSILIIAVTFAVVMLIIVGFTRSTTRAKRAFAEQKEAAASEAYSGFYERSYNAAEAEYHVKNQAVITLGNIREISDLEVLDVSDVVYMIEDPNQQNGKTLSWLEVPGSGVFTVNLSAGEFVVDRDRHRVHVRIPAPELRTDNISIDYANVKLLKFEKEKFSGKNSVKDGEDLVNRQLKQAYQTIRSDIQSNTQYITYAREAARSLTQSLISAVNSEVPDLTVQVEFF